MTAFADKFSELSAEQLSQLETANRLKAEFIANVSHELRTPLHAIIGYADLLLEGIYGVLSAEQEQTVQYIHDSATDLLGLVNNVLDLSKIESGRSDLVLSSFDLRDLIAETFAQVQSLAETKHLALESKVLVDTPFVRTDRGKLKQVLLNLLGNALKFTEHGKVTVTISASPPPEPATALHSKCVLITVEDTGVGIPSDKLGKIFDKFYQVDGSTSRAHEGTGLGLYITKQLLDLLSATIRVESVAGKGTVVSVSLPQNYQEIEAIERLRKRIDAACPLPADKQTSGERLVLVVSDSPHVARVLVDGLSSAGYAVRVVLAGSHAVELARQLKPMAILLNAEKSTSEFWPVFQELKCQPETKDIPTIFVGAGPAHPDLGSGLTVAGPVNRREVLRSIRASTQAGKKNVLIVDDEKSFREILHSVLSAEGYQVSEAADGKEAIEKLNALKPNLLLLDLHMPEIDGWGVIHHIAQNSELKDVEVLVISGDLPSGDEIAAIHALGSGFIRKSDFTVDGVLEKVANLLEVN